VSKEKLDKKKPKKSMSTIDTQAKEQIKQIEGRVEELRKLCLNEINRLEAMFEKQEQEMQSKIQSSVNVFKGDIEMV